MKRVIKLEVALDENRVPETISWDATDKEGGPSNCDAFLLALWSHEENAVYRIDLWTKKMPVGDMSQLFAQTMATMADTYERSTGQGELASRMRDFARDFGREAAGRPEPRTGS